MVNFRNTSLSILLLLWCGCGQDPVAPIVSVTLLSPADGAEVSGFIEVRVEWTGAREVRYEIGDDILAWWHEPPYDFQWNTRGTPNGRYELVAVAAGESNSARAEAGIVVNNIGAGAEAMLLIEPASASVALGDTLRISALVLGLVDRSVLWSVQDGAGKGTIDAGGLYTAPTEPPRPPKAVVVAQSRDDPSVQAITEIFLRAN